MTYSEKLRDPRWQKLRLEVMSRDNWMCQSCGDKDTTLNVHHKWYEPGAEPWEAELKALVTLCQPCHEIESKYRKGIDEAAMAAFKKVLLHRDMISLMVTVILLKMNPKSFCEAILTLPDRILSEAAASSATSMTPEELEVADKRRRAIENCLEILTKGTL